MSSPRWMTLLKQADANRSPKMTKKATDETRLKKQQLLRHLVPKTRSQHLLQSQPATEETDSRRASRRCCLTVTEDQTATDPKGEEPAEVAKVEEKAEAVAPAIEASVTIEAVEIEGDTLFVAGAAKPAGSSVRLYVNNRPISDSKSGETGRFLFDGPLTLEAGDHQARVDLLDPKTGKVAMRAEVSFRKKGEAAMEILADGSVASNAPGGSNVSATSDAVKLKKVIIRRGDNLWEIARRVYGAGIRYSTIYDSNTDQIRDPHWIYPGQVFELPQGESDWETNFESIDVPAEAAAQPAQTG